MNDPVRAQQIVRRQVRRRRRWRRLRIAVLVVLASSAVLAAAFGIDRLAIVVHKFYAEHHHSHPPATGSTNTTAASTTTRPAGSARCDSPALSAVVSDWRETSNTVLETVSLTNISLTPCSLTGYPNLGVVAQGGTPLPATNHDVAAIVAPTPGATTLPVTTVPVGTTTPSAPVTLAHGARASFQLAFANTCDHVVAPGQPTTGTPNECYSGVWLEVTPPQGTSALLVTQPLRLTYAVSGFQVGPFQAGSGLPLAGQPPLTSHTTSPTSPPATSPPTTVPPPTTSPPTSSPPTSSP